MDFEMVIFYTFMEILLDEDASDDLKELRMAALKKLQTSLTHYHRLGYIAQLTTAIAEKKCRMIMDATSRTQMQKFLKPRCPHYDGNKFIEDHHIIPEEELICWSHASLRFPLNAVGAARFKEVFQRVFPNGVNAEGKGDSDE